MFLPRSAITALRAPLEGVVSTATGAGKQQHPACLHPFSAWSSREMPCPYFHPPTSSTGQLCTVCAAQRCVLQALTVEKWVGMSKHALNVIQCP